MNIITKASEQDAAFIAGWEGTILKAYLCPAGVITIGNGFTMRSKVFADYWRKTRGRALRLGDTITQEECRMLLPLVIDEEYGAAVVRKVKPRKQHHYGAASSMSFNCGTGALDWRWAVALAQGDIARAAALLRTTATTANGRTLNGLIRRRQAEARLLEAGDYGKANQTAVAHQSRNSDDIREYQKQLKTLGYYAGDIDGIKGPLTNGAIKNFQRDHRLTVDGIVGPATRATLIRELDKRASNQMATGGGLVGGAGGATTDSLPWDSIINLGATAAAVVTVIVVVSYLWRNRGKLTGQRVPT